MIIRKIEKQAPAPKMKRVAAYARVSDGKDAMLRSLSAQVSYYSDYIQQQKGWIYAGVYSDEAETGTRDNRSGFQTLIAACRAGSIDMVITKSISRFARNTVVMLETVRELKELGVDVYFEKENIHTLSGDGEFMLTILASFSQEESRSVSENCKWRIQKQFENGELACLRFMYGYNINNGGIEINEEQAATVRRIFSMYLDGMGVYAIATVLRNDGVPPFRKGQWSHKRVLQILRNEKYTGNALLQKRYVTDHLTKKTVQNKGEKTQYYAENTHPAIIDTAIFDAVQTQLETKKSMIQTKRKEPQFFAKKLLCGVCGKTYKQHSINGKMWWECYTYFKYGRCACTSQRVPEDALITATVTVLGLPNLDESVFIEEIVSITVHDNNILRYYFTDGSKIDTKWQNKSRRDSWTDEMRKSASEKQKEIMRRRKEQCQQQE